MNPRATAVLRIGVLGIVLTILLCAGVFKFIVWLGAEPGGPLAGLSVFAVAVACACTIAAVATAELYPDKGSGQTKRPKCPDCKHCLEHDLLGGYCPNCGEFWDFVPRKSGGSA